MSTAQNPEEKVPLVVQPTATTGVRRRLAPYFWRSACFDLDPRFTVFACQFIISFVVLALSVIKLMNNDTCPTQSFYGTILSTLIGIWMPSPLSW